MKYLIPFLLVPLMSFSQNKGASPIANSQEPIANRNTYAVVIGISDYQDKDIPDLRYADKDAEAFANFLRSPAGGSLDGDHLQVLTNAQATAGRIAEALDALIEKVKKDDQVIIYFSGHGDVEGKKLTQPGFLLCWDSPSRVYMGGGTYSLSFLQEVVSTLSVTNQAKVVVITDACHAGKLAGSQIGGAQLTTSNLAKQYANEVKILSCQPNEFSLEGPQWGGGRGVFSYHLVDGLFGLADRNNDGQITLGEIDRYLEDHVTEEATPQSQVPILLGNKTDRLATVNPNILAELKKNKTVDMAVFAATESRGFEEEILSKVDTSIREMYKHFKLAVLEKRFFVPAGSSAEDYYVQLEKVELLAPLRGIMKRNYAAELQDDAQQVMNKWLKTDINEIYLSKTTRTEKYQAYPKYLERAAILLGKDHYMYPLLMARMHFFKGYLLALSSRNPDKKLAAMALSEFKSALQWQPDLPHAYWQMSNVYGYNLLQADSAEICAKLAIELQPTWVLPNTNLAFLFSEKLKLFERAKPFLENANRLEPESALVKNNWGIYHINRKQYPEAEKYLKLAIEADSTYGAPLANLALIYRIQKRQLESELYFKKAIKIDPTYEGNYGNLAGLYHDMQRYPEAEQQFITALKLDSAATECHFGLGNVYASMGRILEAEVQYKKAIQLDSLHFKSMINLGKLYERNGRIQDAEILYKKFQQLDSLDYDALVTISAFYFNHQRWDQVFDIYEKMLLIDSTRPDAYNLIGAIYMDHLKRYPEAEQQFKKVIALDSLSIEANYNLSHVYILTQRFEEAEQQLMKVLHLNSNDVDAHWSLGRVCQELEKFDAAANQFKAIIAIDSNNAGAYVNLGETFQMAGKKELIVPTFLKVLELQQAYAVPYALNGLAVYYLGENNFRLSEEYVNKAIEMYPELPNSYLNLGEIYMKSSRKNQAKSLFEKALSIDPEDGQAYYLLAILAAQDHQYDQAFEAMEQSLIRNFKNYNKWISNADMNVLHQDARWKTLMQKYFPDKIKN